MTSRSDLRIVVHEEDADGGSRTARREVELEAQTVVAGEEALLLSQTYPVNGAIFVEIPEGVFDSDFHVAPREQLIVILHGRLRTETTDGIVTELGPGEVILVRDVTGRGHRASVVEAPLRVLFLPVA